MKAWFKNILKNPVPEFPRTIQIQTIPGCNARCIFCPNSDPTVKFPPEKISSKMFEDILKEASKYSVKRISPYLMNEPLLDKSLPEKLLLIKQYMPHAKLNITTNGALLKPDFAERLLQTRAIHNIYFSVQGIDKNTYKRVMPGLDLETVMENVKHFVAVKTKIGLKRPHVIVTMVKTNKIDVDKAVNYWKSIGIISKYTVFENRGGNIDKDLACNGHMNHYSKCTRLFKQCFILANGDVALCCTDYRRIAILGSLKEKTIHEIWNGKKAIGIRRLYLSKQFDKIPLCRDCEIEN